MSDQISCEISSTEATIPTKNSKFVNQCPLVEEASSIIDRVARVERAKHVKSIPCYKEGRIAQMSGLKIVRRKDFSVVAIKARPPGSSRKKKLLVGKGNEDSNCRGLGIGAPDRCSRNYWSKQRQEVRLCLAMMVVVALAVLVPTDLDHFLLERRTTSTSRLAR